MLFAHDWRRAASRIRGIPISNTVASVLRIAMTASTSGNVKPAADAGERDVAERAQQFKFRNRPSIRLRAIEDRTSRVSLEIAACVQCTLKHC
jgi:hypothetical protein